MANTYTHSIISLKKTDEVYPDTVKSFIVQTTVSDGTNQISKQYTVDLESPTSEEYQTFTNYADLEEADLISWLDNDYIQIEHIKKEISRELEKSLHTEVTSNFPWS